MLSGGDYTGLIGDIYQAAIEPARWPAVTRRLAAAAGVAHAVVGAIDEHDPAFAFLETHDLSADDAGLLRDECLGYLARCAVPAAGVLRVTMDRPARVGGGLGDAWRAGVVVGDGGSGRGAICLHQALCDGPVPASALDIVSQVAPHFGSALRVHRRRLVLEGAARDRADGRRTPGDAPGWRALDGEFLAGRYGLTERELAVCEQFLNLASVDETSAALRVEMSTVRFHLKNIYEKTGLRTLPALMRLLVESRQGFRPGEPARKPSATRARGDQSP